MRLTRRSRPEGHTVTMSPARTDPGQNLSGVAAEILIRPDDELDRKSQRTGGRVTLDVQGFEMFEQAQAVEPRRTLAASDDVVAVERAHGNRLTRRTRQERRKPAGDLAEDVLR